VANTVTNVLPKLLAQGLLALRENAIMSRVVNRSYESLAAQKGAVINIPIPSAIAARDVTASVTQNSNIDFSPTVAVVTLDFWKEASFHLSDKDLAECDAGIMPMQASEAVKELINEVDAYLLARTTGFFGYAGASGTTPFNGSLTVAASARMILNRNAAPMSDRAGILDPLAESNFGINANIVQADQRGDSEGIINGVIGKKLGADWYMDQNVQSYTAGTGWASGFIASTVAGAVGDTTLNVINATASGQVKIGDLFRFTADTAHHTYVITVTTTVSATAQSVITFYPALKTTVATGATLVVVSGTYTRNLLMHRDAFAWASRPLADVQGAGNTFATAVDPVSGIALRLEVSRQYKQTTFSYDILGGGNWVRRELGVVILGQ
jgi:hypothetical protein